MRLVAAVLLLAVVGCRASHPAPAIDRLEIRMSGRMTAEIILNDRGEGRYRLGEPFANGRSGAFSLSPQQLAALLRRLRPFQLQSVGEEGAVASLDHVCPRGVPNVLHAGGAGIRWVGRGYDRFYLADFGCDHERNRARNEELEAIAKSLPVPFES